MNLKLGQFHQKWSFSGTRLVECGWTWCFCFLFNCVCHPCDIFVTWKIARKVHLPEVSFLLISGILLYAYGIVGMRSNHSDPLLVRFFVLISVLILILALDLGRRRLKQIKNDLIVQRCTTCIFLLPSCKCFRDRWFQIKWWSDHAWRLSDVVLRIQYVPRCTHRRFRLLRNSPAKLLYEGCHAQARRICKLLIDWFSKYTVITNKVQVALYRVLNDSRS